MAKTLVFLHVFCESQEKLAQFVENCAIALNFLAVSKLSKDFHCESWTFSTGDAAKALNCVENVGFCLRFGVRELQNYVELRDFLRNFEEILSIREENAENVTISAQKHALKAVYELTCR